MKTVCEINQCTACKACISICPKNAVSIKDSLAYENAVIDETACIHCGLCERVCQVKNPVALQKPKKWFQGWSSNAEERAKSSSGAFAYVLAKQIITEGGCVAACKFENGMFSYSLAASVDELAAYRESKYVKSDPQEIYTLVKQTLAEGKQVLFVGLPCHVAALKKYLGKDYVNLITVDLICHGSPSPMLLALFLQQYGIDLNQINSIHFREKGKFRLTGEAGQARGQKEALSFTPEGIKDRYSIAFLNGLTYTENCYSCPYAGIERASDITLGDSWGSDLPDSERNKGISIALCQSEKGVDLLQRSPLDLFDVDLDKAVAANRQLRVPQTMPDSRMLFFREIEKGTCFNKAVKKCFPKTCFRLDLKEFLLKRGILTLN